MAKRNPPDESNYEDDIKEPVNNMPLSGLLLAGRVVDRIRRFVPKDNPSTEIVTYTIDDEAGHKYYVDDYAPNGYFGLDDYVSFPVYIKPYIKRSKEPSYTLGILKTYQYDRGERF